ncbi:MULTISPECIES: NUDIX domain-containing protein [Halorussus]|uniref:NUDIX domain-containing protein n=1 Tax=Halorussus TaxID=1070314 RepID=UPI000E211F89|nr:MULTISPECIES: NUDIX domain-containing protein [Halorussus]NHN61126.1 NUDIX domain-containing protein [Halorussus sp. JP-T4]
MDETRVVTCFLRNRGEVLLLRRSAEVGSYAGQWGGVAGHAEADPDAGGRTASSEPSLADAREDAAAREEIAEETGLLDACTLARSGVTFSFEDEDLDTRWVVHPYLFDCERRDAETDWETAEAEWVHPTEILRRETVPNLWAAYSRVAPTVDQVAEDEDHGSAYVSVRALEVLRDRAGSFAERNAGGWPQLADLAERLLDARPSMAAVGNRVNRAMADAADDGRTAGAVERAARDGIERAYRAGDRAAELAADEIRGERVLTLSRSGTVLDALPAAAAASVAESRPAREGVGVAEALAEGADGERPDVTLHTDAAAAHVLATGEVDAVVVGADAVLPDGRVVNKTGTRGTALAAAREGVPVYAVAAGDKVRTDETVHLEDGDPGAVYDGEADLEVLNPTFDVTPADLVSGVVTERGMLDADGVSAVAEELRELAAWRDGSDRESVSEQER